MQSKLRFLGTGNSTGVPVIGCPCEVCHSKDPLNQRSRPGVLLTIQGQQILIDASQDFRMQALKYHIHHLDGLILTHPHYDHIAGLDDLRIYYLWSQKPIPCLLSRFTADDITERFDYIFKPKSEKKRLISRIDLKILEGDRGDVSFLGIPIHFFTYVQADMPVTGIRIANFAFVTDIRDYPETIFEDLQGVDTLVLSALRHEPTHFHFGLEEACSFASKVGAKQTWLTHVAHELEHTLTNNELPKDVQIAYDGQEILLNFK